MKLFFVVFFLCSLAFGITSETQSEQVKVRLVSSHTSVTPGQGFFVGLEYQIKQDWHIYWKNPGDSGTTPKVNWAVTGAKVLDAVWPTPERFTTSQLVNFGYEHEILLPTELKADDKGDGIKISADIEWLVCKVECVPGFAKLDTMVIIGENSPSPEFQKFATTLTRVPKKGAGAPKIKFIDNTKNVLTVEVTHSAPLKKIDFFPADATVFTAKPLLSTINGRVASVKIPLNPERTSTSTSSGVILVEDQDNNSLAYEVEIPMTVATSNLFLMIAFAFLGGIILNAMPCVFPVLSIKVLSFLGPDRNEKHLRKAGWAYTAGVLVSFFLLGGLLVALRAAGQQLGWGFQLQSPWFVGCLIVLFLGIGLNLLGLFDVGDVLTRLQLPGNLGSGNSLASAFATGFIATVVATPCTAPFMGAAVGYTLSQPAYISLTIFLAIGAGMAFPFLLLCYWTGLINKLPRSGNWMVTFKKAVSIPMFMTAIWLGYILSIQVGSSDRTAASKESPWKPYTAALVEQLKKENKPYFIDFTATWCLTCQVNKKAVLETEEIEGVFKKTAITLIKADWTKQDSEVTKALEARGRNSLPLYVFYDPSTKQEKVLPEILTKKMIYDLFTN